MMMTPAAAGDSRQPSRGRTCSDFSIHGPASCFQPMLVHAFEESHSLPRNELETEVERFQSKVKKAVAKDIRKMLQGSKPYTQHYGKPAAISETKLHQLSTPKVTTVHEDTALLIEAGDYHKYARARANQLQTERSRREKQQVQEQQEAEHRACALDSYRNWKAQVEQQKAARKAHEARVKQCYGQQLARYVAYKADRELAEMKARRQAQQQPHPDHVVDVVDLVHDRRVDVSAAFKDPNKCCILPKIAST